MPFSFDPRRRRSSPLRVGIKYPLGETEREIDNLHHLLHFGELVHPNRLAERTARQRARELIRSGYATEVVEETTAGKRSHLVLTPRGKNLRSLNTFLAGDYGWSKLPIERKEAIVDSYIREMIFSFIYESERRRTNYRAPLDVDEILDHARIDADIPSLKKEFVRKWGSNLKKWPDHGKWALLVTTRKALVAEKAIEWLKSEDNWEHLLRQTRAGQLFQGMD